jgi:hypothetical protein
MSETGSTRRLALTGLAAMLLTALAGGSAMAQGRGWGPDGMGPPGQRRRGWVPPGHRRGWIPPGHRRRHRRGPPPGRGWRRWN